ncbi:MAG: host attachment protein [Rhodospirillales bacterium]|nr:host attachment protein [Rhodospirillales bacterium]
MRWSRPTDPKRYEKRLFAHEMADRLEDARKKGAFDRLVVVAPPEALGDLRAEFGKSLASLVSAEMPKDLTKVPIHALPEFLGEVLAV